MDKTYIEAIEFQHRHMIDGSAEPEPRTLGFRIVSSDEAVVKRLRERYESGRSGVSDLMFSSTDDGHFQASAHLWPDEEEVQMFEALVEHVMARIKAV